MKAAVIGIMVAGCGRVGFDAVAADAVAAIGDGELGDATQIDGFPPDFECVTVDLGSQTGPAVASGTTIGRLDQESSCLGRGIGSPDIEYAWRAPATRTYTFDTCASGFDTVITVLANCTLGPNLGCDDNQCNPNASVNVALAAGQLVVVVVDGRMASGNFTLGIN